jgi:hypothetical protein
MGISVQVVRADYSAVTLALIEAAELHGAVKSAINSDAQCKSIGSTVSAGGVRTTCSWDPDSHAYLVTVQY